MQPFTLVSIASLAGAQAHVAADPAQRLFRAGGVDLLDRQKSGLEAPSQLVQLRAVDSAPELARTDLHPEQGVTIGALVTLAALAEANLRGISRDFAALAALQEAAGQAATPSLRNMATVGGNLLQRPRCWYFRNPELVCLKKGGDTCLAVSGDHRYHAILGGGPSYIVHPSSLGAPLTALDAEIIVDGPGSDERSERRQGPLASLFVDPGEDPTREHRLGPGEVLVSLFVPPQPAGTASAYEAAREKRSHDWPLAEAAVRLRVEGGKIAAPRVALGHVAPVPWPAKWAEQALEGQRPSAALFKEAAVAATEGAKPLADNRYKIPLVQGLVRRALHRAAGVPLPD